MKRASVSETKNRLSRLLEEVKRGESVLVLDRNKPIAVISPYRETGLRGLVREGIVSPPCRKLDVDDFLNRTSPKLPCGASGSAAVIQEREEGV